MNNKSISFTYTLFDDNSNREKSKVMTKWEIVCDDERNIGFAENSEDKVNDFLEWDKTYKLTIEEL